jgi:hypothetical protein
MTDETDNEQQGQPAQDASLFDKATPKDGSTGEGVAPAPAEKPADGRPEWVPEKFWNAAEAKAATTPEERTKLAASAMQKSYNELETRLRNTKPSAAPEKAEEYELKIPETAKAFAAGMKDDDPLLGGYRETAHKLGLSKDQAAGVYQWFAEAMNEHIPPPMDVNAEMEKLGPNAQAFIDDVVGRAFQLRDWGVFSDADIEEYRIACGTAEGMQMMSKLFAHFGEKTVPANIIPSEGGLPSHEELRAMKFVQVESGPNKGQQRYNVDPDYRKKIDAMYDKVYGNEPAGKSRVMAA